MTVSWCEGLVYERRDKGSLADLLTKVNNRQAYHSKTAGFGLAFLRSEKTYQGRDRRGWLHEWFERMRTDNRRQNHLS